MEQLILDFVENSFSGNIPYPALITFLCIKGGVTFNKTEEKCPRSSLITLIGVLKTPTRDEEVERAKKKKQLQNYKGRQPQQLKKSQKQKKLGGFEDYLEQPVLSPNAKETLSAQNRAEKGKMRAEE